MYGGQSTYIPLKVNQAGVIPIIFASSLLYIPVLLSNVVPWLSLRNWVQHNLLNPTDGWYIVFYGLFIVLFTFFYVHVTFDPTSRRTRSASRVATSRLQTGGAD